MPHARKEGRYFAWRRSPAEHVPDYQVLVGGRWMLSATGVGLGLMAVLRRLPPRQRGRAALAALLGSAVAGVGGVLVGVLGAARPMLRRIDLPLPGLDRAWEGRTLLHISDFHLGVPLSRWAARRALALAHKTRPDLIAITGDFVSYLRHLPLLPRVLGQLHAPLGCYAVFGNHDHWTDLASISRILSQSGITLLDNAHRTLLSDGVPLVIAGVDDMWDGRPDLAAALLDVPVEAPVILLAHSPDFASEAARSGVALQLSGHSHGGHIRLPWLGPLFLPRHGVFYDRGLRRVRQMWLYVSHGLGGWPLRIGCRAEVTLFTLHHAERQAEE